MKLDFSPSYRVVAASETKTAQSTTAPASAPASLKIKGLKLPEPLTQTRYLVGGITGSVLGFGIGHAIVGEYSSMGWVFTMSEVLSLSVPILAALVMAIVAWDGSVGATVDHLITTWGGFLWAGIALWAAFRVWEIIDLWMRPRHRIGLPKKTADATPQAIWTITPVVFSDGLGVGIAGRW
jgi:hypothetical protein